MSFAPKLLPAAATAALLALLATPVEARSKTGGDTGGPAAGATPGESRAQAAARAAARGSAASLARPLARPVRGAAHALRVAALALRPTRRIPAPVASLAGLSVRPADGPLSSPFGPRRDPFRKKRRSVHRGLDFEGKRGELVRAAGPGVVTVSRRFGGYGRVVFVDHGNGVQTRYAHLQRMHVRPGDQVPAGALLGTVGSTGRTTGPHLHFEIRVRGRAVDPLRVLAPNLVPEAEAAGFQRHRGGLLALLLEDRARRMSKSTPPPPRRKKPPARKAPAPERRSQRPST